jgi:hypothetical protein
MRAALLCHQEASSTDHALRSGFEAGLDISGLGDSSGREHGIFGTYRPSDSVKQFDRRHGPPNMAPSLRALGDDCVGARVASRKGFLD